MSSKDKESKTFEKLRNFFRVSRGANTNFRSNEVFVLTADIEKELGSESPTNHRMKAIKDLSDPVLTSRLEDYAIEKLSCLLKDLLHPSVEREYRQAVLTFFRCLVQGQYNNLGLMRSFFFKIIQTHDVDEDIPQRLELFQSLTENGKDILYLEQEFGIFLVTWMPAINGAGKTADFLSLLVNAIKYNAAYIDDIIVMKLVQYTCYQCCWSNNHEIINTCLQVLDTIVCYGNLPTESLPTIINTLCRKVNSEAYSQNCWKIMKNLLGTHMGHSTLYNMCKILQDPACLNDFTVLRGAVFYINMGLWSTKRVSSLKCTPTSVLPSFLQAMSGGHTVVVFEVSLSIQRLVNEFGLELQDPAWDLVLSILERIALHVSSKEENKVGPICVTLNDTLSVIERLIELGQFNGSVKKFFDLVELCSNVRPESSVFRLITFISHSIGPTKHEWLTKLDGLLERYLKQEVRPNIRIKALDVLFQVVSNNRYLYLDELIERSVIPYLQNMDMEDEVAVRNKAAQLLIEICADCDSKKCLDLLNILQKILIRPFERDSPPIVNEQNIQDIKTIVIGLTKMFQLKIYQLPSSHAITVHRILVGYLEHHYRNIPIMDYCPNIRYTIFECLLRLRANRLGQIGIFENSATSIKFSPYLIIESKVFQDKPTGSISPPPTSPAPSPYPLCVISTLSLVASSKVIVTALKVEREWKILNLLLQELPKVMQYKSLILSKYGNDIGLLADCLCAMVSDKSLNLPDSLRNLPIKMNRTEFQSYVFPVIASLASYHTHLEPSQQQRCIIGLEIGLASRCAAQCILALTICTLEMRDAMYKLLPEVLLNLSKISATVHIAIPILEFLSTLTRLPKVFASFVGDQYMSVFAIALPYTNPFKYNHYTVSLAHHVIAVWFLKCRLPFRRDFVKFITTGLKANVIVPFEEGQVGGHVLKSDLASLNEDSTSRKRSSSLTEQGSRRRDRPIPNSRLDLKPPIDEALMTFHLELTETCIDLMARYTFSSCAVRPKRSPTVEFLLNGGQSMTWLLGHKLVTVTTSGCSQKPLKNNLCDRCWILCKTDRYHTQVSDPGKEDKLSKQNSIENPSNSDSQLTGNDNKQSEASQLEQLIFKNKNDEHQANKDLCACWCQGWAEIYVRRPTGDMSWVMRIQNETHFQNAALDMPLADVTSLFLPTQTSKAEEDHIQSPPGSDIDNILDHQLENLTSNQSNQPVSILSISQNISSATSNPVNIPGSPGKRTPSRQSSKESVDDVYEDIKEHPEQETDSLRDRSRNPVRRSNSSPEMSASWKMPFLKDKHDDRDLRVSCEAIPEEISGMGTTPPSNDTSPINHVTTRPPPHSPNLDLQKSPKKNNFQKNVKRDNLKLDPKLFLDKQISLSIDVGVKVAVKSPLSMGEIGKSESNRSINLDEGRLDTPFVRDRSRTISVMSPTRRTRADLEQLKKNTMRNKETARSGISPSFVFLQLYHSAHFGSTDERPLLISQNSAIQRAIKALDFIPPFETHKVGVLYVGPGLASNECEILKTQFGSLRYTEFLQNLGTLIYLKDTDPQSMFLGGLDKNGDDGKFAYIWQDDVTQVIFHVATLMPTKESDPKCNAKKAHIGNDFVTIVYNESGEEYNIQTVKGQFNYANVVIQPLDNATNRVTVKARDELPDIIGHSEPKIISDQNVAILARQLALHANLASQVTRSIKAKGQDPYASNWLERLRKIKRLRSKVLQEVSSGEDHHKELLGLQSRAKKVEYMDDFTEYT